jgi:DNA-binding FrmR family transcriptional regulator
MNYKESLKVSHPSFIARSRAQGSENFLRLSPTESPPVSYKLNTNTNEHSISSSEGGISQALERSMALTEEQLHRVLTNYTQLQTQFSDITRAVQDGERTKIDILRQLTAMKSNIEGIGEHLSSTVPTKIYNERRSPDSNVAQEVLLIPELLEFILAHASALDILSVYQTCRGLSAIIDASPSLQVMMFFRPAGVPAGTKTEFKPGPFDHFKWFDLEGHSRYGEFVVTARSTPNQEKGGLPWVGELWKRMQLCQPPLKSMRVRKFCFDCEDNEVVSLGADLYTGKELTFGDLYDMASEILDAGGRCPDCHTPGSIESDVEFVAIDPYERDEEEA